MGLFGLACAILALASYHPGIAPITPPSRATFAQTDIEHGAALAALGDCIVCHTAPNGRPFAGGRGVKTPFGTVYASNITPDPDTGIGAWPLEAFRRAMRDGVGRSGVQLYPVLPYPHFTRATDADIAALYAFMMTRTPVTQPARANDLGFPFNVRPLLAGWNLLFLRQDQWRPDAAKDADWNHGAYLVEAIGHCGACHAPRNALGAQASGPALSGGEADGWDAPPLGPGSPSTRPWTVADLTGYLRTGLAENHGAAAGPMTAVSAQLASVPEADVHAMAVYLAAQMPAPSAALPPDPARSPENPEAVAIFEGACAGCHATGQPSLALSSAVRAPSARDVTAVILHGLPWREGEAAPYMPAFAATLTDAQTAAVAALVRRRYTNLPAWSDIEARVRDARTLGGGT